METFYSLVTSKSSIFIDELRKAVAIQSISAEPAKRGECIRMMHYAKDMIEKLGGTY